MFYSYNIFTTSSIVNTGCTHFDSNHSNLDNYRAATSVKLDFSAQLTGKFSYGFVFRKTA